jgi:anti-sigma regulatory factor (Ser/Thr protein kinase)
MSQIRSSFRAIAALVGRPADALAELDRQAVRIPRALGTTIVYAVVDLDTDHIEMATAGHPAALVSSTGATQYIPTTGLPIGVNDDGAQRTSAVVPYPPDTTVVLFTDGLVERRAEDLGDGLERLRAMAERLDGAPIERLADDLLAVADANGRDDVALLCVRRVTAPPRTFSLRLPADSHNLATLRAQLRRWSAQRSDETTLTSDLLLVTGELAANAMMHAYRDVEPGDVVVEAEPSATGLRVTVRDYGRWVVVRDGVMGGRGLDIVRAVAPDAAVEHDGVGTKVVLTLG